MENEHESETPGIKETLDILVRTVDRLDLGQQEMKGDIKAIRSDLSVVKSDVSELKTDVAFLKSDVGTLKSDVGTLKSDVVILKSDVADLKTDVRRLDSKIDDVAETLVEKLEEVAAEFRDDRRPRTAFGRLGV